MELGKPRVSIGKPSTFSLDGHYGGAPSTMQFIDQLSCVTTTGLYCMTASRDDWNFRP